MYQKFIGIDIGKFDFYVALEGEKKVVCYKNTVTGFEQLCLDYQAIAPESLVVLETTGGYEKSLLRFLQQKKFAVHRANTKKVKHFIRSYGQLGKSDAIDAIGLAQYASERHKDLPLYTENTGENLKKLVERKSDLKHMLVQEKNRLKAPEQGALQESFQTIIQAIQKEIAVINEKIANIYKNDPLLAEKNDLLKSIPGIGEVTATDLLALVPELGHGNRRQIASLCGLAPHPNESGCRSGHRFVRGGRKTIKPVLFLAAMAAARSRSRLGEFYQKLCLAGKPKMVALTALMRKILVIAHAKLRDFYSEKTCLKHS